MRTLSLCTPRLIGLALLVSACEVDPGAAGSADVVPDALVEDPADAPDAAEATDKYGILDGIEYRIPSTVQLTDGAQLLSDLYLAQNEERMRLDFSDDRIFQAFVDRYAAQGIVKADFPMIYERLEMHRARALGVLEPVNRGGDDDVRPTTQQQNFFCDSLVTPLNVLSTGDGGGYANGSCHETQEVEYYSIDLGVYKSTSDGLVSSFVADEIDLGLGTTQVFDVEAMTHTQVAADAHTFLLYTSADLATDIFGTADATYRQLIVPAGHQAVAVDHPIDITNSSSDPTDDGSVRSCLHRGLYTSAGGFDCDYALVDSAGRWVFGGVAPHGIAAIDPVASQSGTWTSNMGAYWAFNQGGSSPPWHDTHHFMPIRGEARVWYYKNIGNVTTRVPGYVPTSFYPDTTAEANLIRLGAIDETGNGVPAFNAASGGICAAGQNFKDGVWVDESDRSIVHFDALVDFGGHCTGNGVDAKLRATITVPVFEKLNTDGSGYGIGHLVTLSMVQDRVDFRWSCFTPDTEILLADDTVELIADIEVGDQVIADETGRTLTVVGLTRGQETRSVYTVIDERGRELTMTGGHAVVLADGSVVRARSLSAGDLMVTEEGMSEIVSVVEEPYAGPVYNLQLGTPEELKALSYDETTLFANGLLTGDHRMQRLMDQHEAGQRRRAELAPTWAQDVRSWERLNLGKAD